MKPKKNRIAIIVPGGIGTGQANIGVPVLERIVKLLAAEFEVTVFQLFPVNNGYEPKGFRLVGIVSSNVVWKAVKLFFIFWRLHRKKKFHIVHGFWALPSGFYAVLLGKLFYIKSIVSLLGGDAVSLPQINYGQLRSFIPRKLVFWTLRHSAETISLTQYLVDNLAKFGYEGREIKVIPWGIDTSIFTFRPKPLPDRIQFLHIGNFNEVKDQETLLNAFCLINKNIPAHLTIIGEGYLEMKVKSLVKNLRLEDSVTFLTPMLYELLPDIYHRSDILLHTSRSEGQCEVVTEAMSCGVVVCGTHVGIMYDLHPACCVTAPVADFRSLSERVLALVKDPERVSELRKAAHHWASQHSLSWTVDQLTLLYDELISQEIFAQ